MPDRHVNALLGYPPDARLLIINADDFGVSHAVNTGILRALTEGVARSATLMAPCPWALHAMRLLREHPEIAFGVHLTIVAEYPDYRWGPLSPRETVPSLLDERGFFFSNDRQAELLDRASLAEVETEFRAQIEAVLAAGLRPTHLDWHCLYDGGRPDIFDMTAGLAREYGLALRVFDRDRSERLRLGVVVEEHHADDLGAVASLFELREDHLAEFVAGGVAGGAEDVGDLHLMEAPFHTLGRATRLE